MVQKKAKRTKRSVSDAILANAEASRKPDLLNFLPIDIMHEIFLSLQPSDLLNLSRTSKTIHSFLMKRSSASYWRESLKKVDGLPPSPEKLIEPAWVALVFSPFCTACGKGTPLGAFWALYM
ncbi:uncharacterized protein B0H18DRAFT_1122895 [Fomitopsis serialis]|uniref:uncharacterized protein n=1 Tax=Fomitopsis serialis TaxID=139415 RepID=UPI00200761D2|nr:uncharacterized protein B0H18DRAFT_1122895 [Neoantrodia serialis]KAH9918634.1 hypothetical protein B0H18DRAFT_1122895 [Neoantrodia serialis]